MTEPSEAAKARAREIIPMGLHGDVLKVARFIQEVSDAAKKATTGVRDEGDWRVRELAPFILPEPVDPVKEALAETYGAAAPEFVSAFNAALAKRGLKIVEATDAE